MAKVTIPPTDFSALGVESAHLPKHKLRAFALMAKKQTGCERLLTIQRLT
jgi:hypothetical protein